MYGSSAGGRKTPPDVRGRVVPGSVRAFRQDISNSTRWTERSFRLRLV